jgi:hypothetical protein
MNLLCATQPVRLPAAKARGAIQPWLICGSRRNRAAEMSKFLNQLAEMTAFADSSADKFKTVYQGDDYRSGQR